MNQNELKQRAQRLANRLNALGFTKDGKAMVVDQAFELVAAEEGYRNQHALRANLEPLVIEANVPKGAAAEDIWNNLVNEMGWNRDSEIIHLEGFIRTSGLMPALAAYAQAVADEESAESDDEPEVHATEHDHVFLESLGYQVIRSEFQHYFWEAGGYVSDDFDTQDAAWNNAWKDALRVVSDALGITEAQLLAKDGGVIRGLMARYNWGIMEQLDDSLNQLGFVLSDLQGERVEWRYGSEDAQVAPSRSKALVDAWAFASLKAGVTPELLAVTPWPAQLVLVEAALTGRTGSQCSPATHLPMSEAISQLQMAWGNEHPYYGRDDWKYDVTNGDTKLSYWEWVQHALEANGGAEGHCATCAAPKASGVVHEGCCTGSEPGGSVPVLNKQTYVHFDNELKVLPRAHLESLSVDRGLAVLHKTDVQLRAGLLQDYEEQFRRVAEEAFENYDFGPEEVSGHNGAESIVAEGTWTKAVFLTAEGASESRKVIFTVIVRNLRVGSVQVS